MSLPLPAPAHRILSRTNAIKVVSKLEIEKSMLLSRAISRTILVAIVVAIILVGLGGYTFGDLSHSSSPSTTVTMTEYIVRIYSNSVNVEVSGTCTLTGNAFASFTTSSYIEAENVTGYFVATITTVSSSTAPVQVHTITISTTGSSTTSNSSCPLTF